MRKFMIMAAISALLISPAIAQDADDVDNLDADATVMAPDVTAEAPEVPLSVDIVEEDSDWEKMQEISNLSMFNEALVSTDLYRLLESGQPYTIFAPTNSAFRKIPPLEKKRLQDPEKLNLLKKTIAYHIAPGLYTAEDLSDGKTYISTLEGAKIQVRGGANNIHLENAKINKRDIKFDHIIVHTIDEVLTEAQ